MSWPKDPPEGKSPTRDGFRQNTEPTALDALIKLLDQRVEKQDRRFEEKDQR